MTEKINYAEVAIPIPVDSTFAYAVPEEFKEKVKTGIMVRVPFRRNLVTAYVLKTGTIPSPSGLKPIHEILDKESFFHESMVPLFEWMSRNYHRSIGEIIRHALPGGINTLPHKKASLTEKGKRYLYTINKYDHQSSLLRWIEENPGKRLSSPLSIAYQLQRQGLIKIDTIHPIARTGPLLRKFVRLKEGIDLKSIIKKRGPRNEADFLKWIQKEGEIPLKIARTKYKNSPYLLKKWIKNGAIEMFQKPILRTTGQGIIQKFHVPEEVSSQQENAMNAIHKAIEAGGFSVCLLYGVAGSGKIEVYFEAIKRVVENGKQAILMVPEIALSAYMEGVFRSKMKCRIGIYHSGLGRREIYDQWISMSRGDVDLVIGARSSVFVPLSRLGLIIIDEEHDTSYKQEEGIWYHVRDVAISRAKSDRAVVILGSGTPSVYSFYHAQKKHFAFIEMPDMITKEQLPEIRLIDMRKVETIDRETGLISIPLYDELKRTLNDGKQALLFLNRRGFHRVYLCRFCGRSIKCLNCDVSLTHHKEKESLLCHYCGYHIPVPALCPYCGLKGILKYGAGTERLEKLLQDLFPEARVERMDSDSIRTKGSSYRILKDLYDRKIDILVGTQIVTKGYNFPEVNLVGVIAADLSLNFPDYMASERTFQTLMQIAGRVGRGDEKGVMIIQSFNPEHYTISAATSRDFRAFFNKEIALRRTLGYPPIGEIAVLRVEGKSKKNVERISIELINAMKQLRHSWFQRYEDIGLLGPAEAPIFKLRGKYRYQILVKANDQDKLNLYLKVTKEMAQRLLKRTGATFIIDFNP